MTGETTLIIEVIIALLFGGLALFGLILWRSAAAKIYDPNAVIADGDFDPQHDYYSSKYVEMPVAEEVNETPAKADASVKSDSMSLTEHSWLTPPELIDIEEPLSSTEHRKNAERRQNQTRSGHDRRDSDDRRVTLNDA